MASTLRLLWATLVVVGVAVGVVPSFGFSVIEADRGVDVGVASDENALLALEQIDTEVRTTTPVPVARLRNNVGSAVTVTYRVAVDTGALSTSSGSTTTTLATGGVRQVEVSCTGLSGASGVATLTVTVEQADGGSVSVSGATLEVPVRYDCTRRGPPGDAVAYDDVDRDLQYDDGETTYTAAQLAGEFEREGVDLVIDTDQTIDADTSELAIQTRTITVFDATLRSKKEVTLEADSGVVDLRGATLASKTGEISVKGRSVSASDTTVETNKEITLEAESGNVTLTSSTLDSKTGEISLKGAAVTATDSTLETRKAIKVEAESGGADVSRSTLDSKTGEITVKGSSVTATDATLRTSKEITLEAESGAIDARRVTLETKNAEIAVSAAGTLDATGASLSAKNGEISLASSGDMTLVDAVIETDRHATATLNTASATLAVDGLAVRDADATLTYSPAGVTVTGTPAEGQLRAE